MIISRTPLRMSFVGGGSDIASFYKKSPGAVISTSINKYMYIMLKNKFSDGYRISYSQTELVENKNEIQHPIVKNILNFYQINEGLEITSIADIPSKGSGLGSSSSFTVGMLNVINKFLNHKISNFELGKLASEVEIYMCKEPIGKQDQYAAALGGLNHIKFNEDETVDVYPIKMSQKNFLTFEKHILLFYTGITRSASKVLREQTKNLMIKENFLTMKKMVELTNTFKHALENFDLQLLSEVLDENWKLKKQLAQNVSNSLIDDMILKAKKLGAWSGKILGAGNGGFIMLLAPTESHSNIVRNLGLKHVPISFDNKGTQVLNSDQIFDVR